MINSAAIKIIDEISFIYIKKREELHDLMQVKKTKQTVKQLKLKREILNY
ncbi:MAG: hypothetical protein sL5_01840 [Candidatus Mesenet longicola]|uniref:Uncharacterized protein n=1 Tax=Candidatus Mesenet longicola TaxID=1892558 RepID=A0A8J3HX40_9RICK|nr:MAG: hypothetical protein sGL2_01550 [Candidatus Mesenet longicola]GHM59191.1 MAG: hypothetical protein sL5_01840 [Candidatus Mesenet longicola]